MNGRTAFVISRAVAMICAVGTIVSAAVNGLASQYMVDKAVDEAIEKRENRIEE